MSEMLSINEARTKGIARLRLDEWSNPSDHIEFNILDDGMVGPWVKLWSPINEVIGQKNPQQVLITMVGDPDAKIWRAYAPN